MIVEANHLDKVILLLLILLQLLLDDLLEAVDDELLDEGGRGLLGQDKLLVGPGVLLQPLHVEEGEGDVQLGAARKLLYALPVHPLDLDYQQLAVLVHLGEQLLLLGLLHLYRAVVLDAGFDVLLNIAHQEHVGIFIVLAVVDELEHIHEVLLELLPRLELEVGGEEVVDIALAFVADIHANEGQPAEPYHHRPLEVEGQQRSHLADGEHEDGPEVVGREYAIELADLPVVVGLVEVVEVEEPEGREEHQGDVDPGLREGREAEEELADDLVYDENDLPVRGLAGRDGVGRHAGLEEGHGYHGRYEDEDGGEEEGDAGVDEVLALEADHVREEGHDLDGGVVVGGAAANDAEEKLGDGDEEEGDKEWDNVCEEDEGKGESELLAVEGVADVDDVENYQDYHEDNEVEHSQECVVVDAGEEVVDRHNVGCEVEYVVEGGAPVPDHQDGGVEGELDHLQVVHPRLVQQIHYRYVLVLS